MQANIIDNTLTVIEYGTVESTDWLTTDCFDYEHYRELPKCVEFQGIRYGLTGWNSDRCIACYQSDANVASYRTHAAQGVAA